MAGLKPGWLIAQGGLQDVPSPKLRSVTLVFAHRFFCRRPSLDRDLSKDTEIEVDWRAIAQDRWPMSKIEGDGPFVAMPRGEASVYLFTTLLERSTSAPPNSKLLKLHPPGRRRDE